MANLNINLRDCDDSVIAKTLRQQLRVYDDNPLKTWRWWSGFLWGAVIIAALDFGDVHICLGSCSSKYSVSIGEPTP